MAAACEASADIHDHGTPLDQKKIRVQCNHCGKVMSGFFRLKSHLGGVGKDVLPCDKVPQNVMEEFRKMLLKPKRQNLGKEVGKLYYPDLPCKRNLSPILNGAKHSKREAHHATVCVSETHSLAEDGGREHTAVHDGATASKTAVHAEANEAPLSRHVQKCIGRFFYETGINLSAANSPSFHRMIHAILGSDHQVTYKIPTSQELKGWILDDETKEIRAYVEKIRHSWTNTGCSILLDSWVGEKGQNLVNFVVECPEGPIYLRSANVSTIINDVDALLSLLDGVIEEVGVDNVVQIVACSTTGWVGAVGKQFMNRRRTVFWSVSASHCIELMLEKIGEMRSIQGVVEKAKIITKFIYQHSEVLKLLRKHTHGYDLIKPSKTKVATTFLTLENLISQKKNLNEMFTSLEWKTSVWASRPEGKRVADLAGDLSFWTAAETTLKATVPLLRVLWLICESDRPLAGYIYETMDQVKETIKEEFKKKKSQYNPFWEVIDEIWDNDLHSPLHAAGYYLNPSLFYSTDFYSDPEVAFGLLCCIVRMVQDQRTQDLISLQLDEYRNAGGAFKEGSATVKRTNVPLAQWWSTHGKQYSELQRFAIRILSQTCDGPLRYGLKRDLAEKLIWKGRNNSNEQRELRDWMFVHYNLQLRNKHLGLANDLLSEEIDARDDWIIDDASDIEQVS